MSTNLAPIFAATEMHAYDQVDAEAMSLLNDLRTYLKEEDIERVKSAFEYAKAAHEGQFRASGDAYISHPLAVARILSEWHLDAQVIMAALMHDVVEDTEVTTLELGVRFGKTVASLVDGVSKLDKLEFRSAEEAQAENFRKMLLAMANDLRVILIKLGDRLHNMRTLGAVRAAKQKRIANETLDIYAPIAHRLGFNDLYRELENLSFRYLYPRRYFTLEKAVARLREQHGGLIKEIEQSIQHRLQEFNVICEVIGRPKSLYQVYKKMIQQKANGSASSVKFNKVQDIYGFRVIVKDLPGCYLALGALHTRYTPQVGSFKDYIAIPKDNGYQSLHTKLSGPYNTLLEIQILSEEMNQVANAGVASYWLYQNHTAKVKELYERTNRWLKNLLEIPKDSIAETAEFLEHIKVDLYPGEVFVYTPKNEILSLPRGATPVDFAYAIHTELGNKCVGSKINGELFPLRTKLKNGDRIEIITSDNAHPKSGWLYHVATGKARSHIRHYLRTAQYELSAQAGLRFLNQALRPFNIHSENITDLVWDQLIKEFKVKDKKDLFVEIGLGKILSMIVAQKIAHILTGLYPQEGPQSETPLSQCGSLVIHGTEGVSVQFARCCSPIPGDAIVGVIKSTQDLEVHLRDCAHIKPILSDYDKWFHVEWASTLHNLTFEVAIEVIIRHQRGALASVTTQISSAEANINDVSMSEDDNSGMGTSKLYFLIEVKDRIHLARVLRAIRHAPEVISVRRTRQELNSD